MLAVGIDCIKAVAFMSAVLLPFQTQQLSHPGSWSGRAGDSYVRNCDDQSLHFIFSLVLYCELNRVV